jgi:group I intron endonuclease
MKLPKYNNADTCKAQILSENKNKSGVYMFKNLLNGKQYIGSEINLSERLSSYYSTTYMENALKRSNSHIYRALLKNGHEKLSLTILEYCDKEKCIEREDFYLSSENNEYNINQKAGSPLGRKHYDETKQILSDANKGKTLSDETKKIMSDAKKGHKHSEETNKIMSDVHKGKTHSEETKNKISLSMPNSSKI